MKYGSVCSGIEAATVAWHPLGWTPAFFSEIEAFPNAVLKAHYSDVPNYGDMTKFKEWPREPIELLVGGTPCQSFSVEGLRKGMDDPRGNLALVFLAIADRLRPRWVVWENVPGVLSSDEGRDFGCFLGGLGELGYGFAYRILDAQYCGVPQRRRRVFVVGHLGDWRPAAAVLFERESLSWNPPPSREAGERVAPCLEGRAGRSGETNFHTSGGLTETAPTIPSRSTAGGGMGTDFDLDGELIARPLRGQSNATHREESDTYIPVTSPAIKARDYKGPSSDGDGDGAPLITHPLKAEGHDASEDGTGRGVPIVTHQLDSHSAGRVTEDGTGRGTPIIGVNMQGNKSSAGTFENIAPSLNAMHGHDVHAIAAPLSAGNNANSNAAGRRREDDENLVIAPCLRSNPYNNSDPGMESKMIVPVAMQEGQTGCREYDTAGSLRANGPGHDPVGTRVRSGMQVRRRTPRECERLQGFPDDYTLVPYRKKPAADGPRYKALGNSMAVPVMRWIGERIKMVNEVVARSGR